MDFNAIGFVIISMVSCQKGPIRHAYAWQIGPFWHDTLDIYETESLAGCPGKAIDVWGLQHNDHKHVT